MSGVWSRDEQIKQAIDDNNNNGHRILFSHIYFLLCVPQTGLTGHVSGIVGSVSSKGETDIPAKRAGAGLACRPWVPPSL